MNIFKESGPLALTEVDEGSVGLRAYMASSEAQVDKYREGTAGVMRLMEQVDGEMGAARQRAAAASEGAKAIAKAFATHLPSITKDCAGLAKTALTLQEDLIALESRLFSLLLARSLSQQGAWERKERAGAAAYASGKEELLVKAKGDATVAAALLALEEEAEAEEREREREAAGGGGSDGVGATTNSQQQQQQGGGGVKQRYTRTLGPRGAPVNFKSSAAAGSLLPSDFNQSGVAAMAAAINSNLKAAMVAGVAMGGVGVNTVMGGLGAAGGALLAKYSASASASFSSFSAAPSSSSSSSPPTTSSTEPSAGKEATKSVPAAPSAPSDTPADEGPKALSPAAFEATEAEKKKDPYVPFVRVKDLVQQKSTPASPQRPQPTANPTPAPAPAPVPAPAPEPPAKPPTAKAPVAAPAAPAPAPTPSAATSEPAPVASSTTVPVEAAPVAAAPAPAAAAPAKKAGGRVAALANKFAAEKKKREESSGGGGAAAASAPPPPPAAE